MVAAIPAAIRKLSAPPMPPNNNATLEATRKYQESRVDADPSIYFTRSRVDLADGKVPDTEFGRRIAHSYTDHGGWYVMVVPTAYQMEYLNGDPDDALFAVELRPACAAWLLWGGVCAWHVS